MKKIKIGIPRSLLYYRYGVLWKNFFVKLGCNVILSKETNQEILNQGIKNTIDESCLSYKIYVGHILSLINNCDYILISRVCDYGKKDKVCTRFNGIYDNIKYIIPKEKILKYNIEYTKFKYEIFGFIKIGFKINKNIFKIIYSYLYAKKKQRNHDICKENEEYNKIMKKGTKILLMSHFYNLYDNYISKYIIDYLKEKDITVIYSDRMNKKQAREFSKYFSQTLYWRYSKEMVGSLYYLKNCVDGIIFISAYPCGIDSLVNNLIMLKNKDIPKLNIIIDENVTKLSLETKLESFLDIVKGAENE